MTNHLTRKLGLGKRAVLELVAAMAIAGPLGLGLMEPSRCLAQSAEPRFEVVSIKPVPPNAPIVFREQGFTPVLPGGQFVDIRTNLLFLVSFAYDVRNPSQQLEWRSKWKGGSYSIAAKPAPGFPALSPAENFEQVRLMIRAMLEDRFHIRLHTETREAPIFTLGVAKGGLKIKEAAAPVPPEREEPVGAAMGDSGGRMIGKKSTMEGMAKALVIFLKRPVIDQTGLKGYYDFDVRWRAPEIPGMEPPNPGLGASGIAMLISNLRDQFGLDVKSGQGSVKYWVVDNAEPPAEN